MPLPQDRPLSAMALKTYLTCPLRFRYRYIDNLAWSYLWSGSEAERQAVERGQAFHLMARRYYAGVDSGRVADPVEQKELEGWLHLLQNFLPRSFDRLFYPELELHLNQPELKLIAKFDLVVVDPDGRATIFDWKTEAAAPRRKHLLERPQTLVYRYMLCAAGGAYSPRGQFLPEEISMVYWNPIFPQRWDRLEYSREQYEKDELYLRTLSAEIERTPREGFRPTADARPCRTCEYRAICHGQPAEEFEAEEFEFE